MWKALVLRMLHTQSTWFPFITYVKTGAGLRGVTPLTTACPPPSSYVENLFPPLSLALILPF